MSYDRHEEAALPSPASGTRRRRVHAPHVPAQRRAFGRLYRQHFGLVWSMVRRFGVPVAQHEDAVQEVWITAYRRLHTLDPEASAKAWLSTITRRVAFRLRRTEHRRRRKIEAIEDAVEMIERPAPDSVDTQDARRLLDALFERLDDEQRVALLLASVHGLTGPEIAQTLEIPVNTAYSRVRLARRKVARFADEVGAEQATLLRALRRREQPPRRAAASAWLLLTPKLGDLAIGGAAGKAGAIGSVLGVMSSAKVFAVTLAVGVVGLTGARMSLGEPIDEPVAGSGVVRGEAARGRAGERSPEPIAVEARAESLGGASVSPAVSASVPSGEAAPTTAGLGAVMSGSVDAATSVPERESSGPGVPAAGAAEGVDGATDNEISGADRATDAIDDGVGMSGGASGGAAGPTLSAEAQLLGRAQRSIAAGRPSEALRLLEEHERRFPAGQLVDARRGARVRALCDLGRGAQARAEARQLAASHPDSPVAAGILDVCT